LENIKLENHDVVGFQRLQVIYESGNFKVITNELFNPENYIYWRFFDRNFETFGKSSLHNPGFELIERKLIYAKVFLGLVKRPAHSNCHGYILLT
jgi:hypothetical protein